MTDEELVQLKKVIIIPDTVEEVKRVVNLLWTFKYNEPWSDTEFKLLEKNYNDYKLANTVLAIVVPERSRIMWDSLEYFENSAFEDIRDYEYIYLNSKDMKKRSIEITLAEAKAWYKSNNPTLKELALKTYEEKELKALSYAGILALIEQTYPTGYTVGVPLLEPYRKNVEAQLAWKAMAFHYNDGWCMKAGSTGYFLRKCSSPQLACTCQMLFDTPYRVGSHLSTMDQGIVYFESEADLLEAARIMMAEDKLKYLFD